MHNVLTDKHFAKAVGVTSYIPLLFWLIISLAVVFNKKVAKMMGIRTYLGAIGLLVLAVVPGVNLVTMVLFIIVIGANIAEQIKLH